MKAYQCNKSLYESPHPVCYSKLDDICAYRRQVIELMGMRAGWMTTSEICRLVHGESTPASHHYSPLYATLRALAKRGWIQTEARPQRRWCVFDLPADLSPATVQEWLDA